MAADWIKMRVNLTDDPAVIRMADVLDVSEYEVVGMLHKFWSWADSQTEDGNAFGVTEKWIDRYIGVTGFTKALSEGDGKKPWLRVTSDGIKIPEFDKHNGKSSKKRADTANRVRRHREKNVKRKRNAVNVTKALPEKRREEKKEVPVQTLEREVRTLSDVTNPGGPALSYSEDPKVKKWIHHYQSLTPTNGYAFRGLSPVDVKEAVAGVEDLIEMLDVDKACALLSAVFKNLPRPTSVKQAVFRCNKLQEEQSKASKDRPSGQDVPDVITPERALLDSIRDSLPDDLKGKVSISKTSGGTVCLAVLESAAEDIQEHIPPGMMVEII